MTQSTEITETDIELFADHLAGWGSSRHTIRGYVTDLRMLRKAMPDLTLEGFADEAARWVTSRKADSAPATTNRRLAAFNKFAKWKGVPGLQEYRRPRGAQRPKARVHIGNVRETLAAVKVWEFSTNIVETRNAYALIALCGMAGLRVHETLEIGPASFGPQEGDVLPMIVRGKGGKERVVPFPVEHYDHLMALNGGSPSPFVTVTDERSARWIITKAFDRLGHPKVESHDLRHAFATAAFDTCKDIVLVQKLLGHSDVKTTQRYIHTPFEESARVVTSLGSMA